MTLPVINSALTSSNSLCPHVHLGGGSQVQETPHQGSPNVLRGSGWSDAADIDRLALKTLTSDVDTEVDPSPSPHGAGAMGVDREAANTGDGESLAASRVGD